MMISVFTIYFFAMLSIYARKRKLAIGIITFGLLFAIFMLWFHATDKLGILL